MKIRAGIIPGIIVICVICLFMGGCGTIEGFSPAEQQPITVMPEDIPGDIPADVEIVEEEQSGEDEHKDDHEEETYADELSAEDADEQLTGNADEQLTEDADEPPAAATDDEQPDEQAPEEDEEEDVSDRLEVHFIDVGQGDATLITCGDESMLIDAGDEGQGTAIQLYLKKHNVEKLKYVIATHPDADHIGGLDVIIYKFDCGQILLPNCSKDTYSFEQLEYSMKAKGYLPHVVDIGEKYSLGDARIEILSPSSEFTFSDTNDSSIVFRLDHGDNSFLFTGDATIPPQQALIYDPDLDIDVDVLKVPHHGAATAYIKGFYDEVTPEYAVISCGSGNPYGHPRQEVLDDLRSRGTKLFRTDEQGTIVATSDGSTISFDTDPSMTWAPGEIPEYDPLQSDENFESNGITRETPQETGGSPESKVTYVYNKNSGKFHYPDCTSVNDMSPKNREDLYCSREELLELHPDAQPCKRCKP